MTILPLRAKAETVVELVAQLDKDLTEKKEKYLMEEILKKQVILYEKSSKRKTRRVYCKNIS